MKIMLKVFGWTFVILLGLWIGVIVADKIVANKESHVRIAYNLGETFFNFIEKSNMENRAHKINDHRSHPITELVNTDDFPFASVRLFNPDEYRFIKKSDGRLLIYRGDMPPADVDTEEALRLMSYDPTNGTYSVGYNARIIKM